MVPTHIVARLSQGACSLERWLLLRQKGFIGPTPPREGPSYSPSEETWESAAHVGPCLGLCPGTALQSKLPKRPHSRPRQWILASSAGHPIIPCKPGGGTGHQGPPACTPISAADATMQLDRKEVSGTEVYFQELWVPTTPLSLHKPTGTH